MLKHSRNAQNFTFYIVLGSYLQLIENYKIITVKTFHEIPVHHV